jgi:prepilin-type N-terminal cleavage/methylation domain-containing protein
MSEAKGLAGGRLNMGINRLKKASAFTLVEVMVVIMIVSILVAVAVPMMRGQVDTSKWSEGKTIMGSIATAIRTYAAEHDRSPGNGNLGTPAYADSLGFGRLDLDGTYFHPGDFEISDVVYDPANGVTLQFLITATKTGLEPGDWTLNQNGVWGHK